MAAALAAPAHAAAPPFSVLAAHVIVTLERDGVIDVLAQADVLTPATYAARREITMQRGELFAQPSLVVNEEQLRAGDGRQDGTFRVSRGTRGVRFEWRQPRGPGSIRIGYRLALLGTAYTDVVDLRVPVWEKDWPVDVGRLTATLKLPRPARGRVFAWVEPDDLAATVTKTPSDVRISMRNVPRSTAVTLHVVFPRGVLSSTGGVNVRDKPALASILAERRGGDGWPWWVWALIGAATLALSAAALRTARSLLLRRR